MCILRKSVFFRVISVVVCIAFLTLDVTWADPEIFTAGRNLAVQSYFQMRMFSKAGVELKGAFESAQDLIGSSRLIGEFLLGNPGPGAVFPDPFPIERMDEVLREELGMRLEGIDTSQVELENGVVTIPYDYLGNTYRITVTLVDSLPEKELEGFDLVIDDFAIGGIPEDLLKIDKEDRSRVTGAGKEGKVSGEPFAEITGEVVEKTAVKGTFHRGSFRFSLSRILSGVAVFMVIARAAFPSDGSTETHLFWHMFVCPTFLITAVALLAVIAGVVLCKKFLRKKVAKTGSIIFSRANDEKTVVIADEKWSRSARALTLLPYYIGKDDLRNADIMRIIDETIHGNDGDRLVITPDGEISINALAIEQLGAIARNNEHIVASDMAIKILHDLSYKDGADTVITTREGDMYTREWAAKVLMPRDHIEAPDVLKAELEGRAARVTGIDVDTPLDERMRLSARIIEAIDRHAPADLGFLRGLLVNNDPDIRMMAENAIGGYADDPEHDVVRGLLSGLSGKTGGLPGRGSIKGKVFSGHLFILGMLMVILLAASVPAPAQIATPGSGIKVAGTVQPPDAEVEQKIAEYARILNNPHNRGWRFDRALRELKSIGMPASPVLREYFLKNKDEILTGANKVLSALRDIEGDAVVDMAVEGLYHKSANVIPMSIEMLTDIGGEEAIAGLAGFFNTVSMRAYQGRAARALVKIGGDTVPPVFLESIKTGEEKSTRKRFAIRSLGELGYVEAIPLIAEALWEDDGFYRAAAADALRLMDDNSVIEPLIRALWDEDREEGKEEVIKALVSTRDKRAVMQVIRYIKDGKYNVRNGIYNLSDQGIYVEDTEVQVLMFGIVSMSKTTEDYLHEKLVAKGKAGVSVLLEKLMEGDIPLFRTHDDPELQLNSYVQDYLFGVMTPVVPDMKRELDSLRQRNAQGELAPSILDEEALRDLEILFMMTEVRCYKTNDFGKDALRSMGSENLKFVYRLYDKFGTSDQLERFTGILEQVNIGVLEDIREEYRHRIKVGIYKGLGLGAFFLGIMSYILTGIRRHKRIGRLKMHDMSHDFTAASGIRWSKVTGLLALFSFLGIFISFVLQGDLTWITYTAIASTVYLSWASHTFFVLGENIASAFKRHGVPVSDIFDISVAKSDGYVNKEVLRELSEFQQILVMIHEGFESHFWGMIAIMPLMFLFFEGKRKRVNAANKIYGLLQSDNPRDIQEAIELAVQYRLTELRDKADIKLSEILTVKAASDSLDDLIAIKSIAAEAGLTVIVGSVKDKIKYILTENAGSEDPVVLAATKKTAKWEDIPGIGDLVMDRVSGLSDIGALSLLLETGDSDIREIVLKKLFKSNAGPAIAVARSFVATSLHTVRSGKRYEVPEDLARKISDHVGSVEDIAVINAIIEEYVDSREIEKTPKEVIEGYDWGSDALINKPGRPSYEDPIVIPAQMVIVIDFSRLKAIVSDAEEFQRIFAATKSRLASETQSPMPDDAQRRTHDFTAASAIHWGRVTGFMSLLGFIGAIAVYAVQGDQTWITYTVAASAAYLAWAAARYFILHGAVYNAMRDHLKVWLVQWGSDGPGTLSERDIRSGFDTVSRNKVEGFARMLIDMAFEDHIRRSQQEVFLIYLEYLNRQELADEEYRDNILGYLAENVIQYIPVAKNDGYRHGAFPDIPYDARKLITIHEGFRSHFWGMVRIMPLFSLLWKKRYMISADRAYEYERRSGRQQDLRGRKEKAVEKVRAALEKALDESRETGNSTRLGKELRALTLINWDSAEEDIATEALIRFFADNADDEPARQEIVQRVNASISALNEGESAAMTALIKGALNDVRGNRTDYLSRYERRMALSTLETLCETWDAQRTMQDTQRTTHDFRALSGLVYAAPAGLISLSALGLAVWQIIVRGDAVWIMYAVLAAVYSAWTAGRFLSLSADVYMAMRDESESPFGALFKAVATSDHRMHKAFYGLSDRGRQLISVHESFRMHFIGMLAIMPMISRLFEKRGERYMVGSEAVSSASMIDVAVQEEDAAGEEEAGTQPLLKPENIVPVVTPLVEGSEKTEVDRAGVRRLLKYLTSIGVASILVMGTTGEFVDLSNEQRIEGIKIFAEEAHALSVESGGSTAFNIFANVTGSRYNEGQAIRNMKMINSYAMTEPQYSSIKAVVLAPLVYLRDNREIREHFVQGVIPALEELESIVGDGTEALPLLLYNNPAIHVDTGLNISPDAVKTLVRHPSVGKRLIGLKDSSNDLDVLASYAREIPTYTGDGGHIVEAMERGALGAVGALGNITYHQQAFFHADDREERGALQHEINTLRPHLVISLSKVASAVKYYLSLAGVCSGRVADTSPGRIIDREERQKIEREYLRRQGMPVVVSGATGFIGSNLINLMGREKIPATGLARKNSDNIGRVEESKYTAMDEADLLNPDYDDLDDIMRSHGAFYHLGGMSNHARCSREPEKALAANSLATAIMARMAQKRGTKMIFSSTFYIYSLLRRPYGPAVSEEDAEYILAGNEPEIQALRQWLDICEEKFSRYAADFVANNGRMEETPVEFVRRNIIIPDIPEERLKELGLPKDYFYPLTKVLAERFVSGMDKGIIMRFSNIYGPRQDEEYKVPMYINSIAGLSPGSEFKVWKHGARDYLYVDDCVSALLKASLMELNDDNRVINIASGMATTNIDIGRAITGALGNMVSIREDDTEDKPVHICDNTRFRQYLHPEEVIPLEDGIDRTLDYYYPEREWSRDNAVYSAWLEGKINSNRARLESAGNIIVDYMKTFENMPFDTELPVIDRKNPTSMMKKDLFDALKALEDLREFARESAMENPELPEIIQGAEKEIKDNIAQLDVDSMIASLIVMARRAKREGQNLIVGFETGWIPGYEKDALQQNALNPLVKGLDSLGKILKSMGLDNVILVHTESINLAKDVLVKARETDTRLSNIVVLGAQKTIDSSRFDDLRSDEDEKRAFLAGINPEKLGNGKKTDSEYYMIEIIEMLEITLSLAMGRELNTDDIDIIESYDAEKRQVTYLPNAHPEDYDKLRLLYLLKRQGIDAAA